MKILKGFIILIIAVSIVSCSSDDKKQSAKKTINTNVVKNSKTADKQKKPYELPKMKFEETTHDFGRIIKGEKIAVDYRFRNTGKSALVITNVKTTCGCTVGKFPRHAIMPGEQGKIEVVFDSKGKRGFQNKTITVLANTEPNANKLFIKGVVSEPEKN